MKSPPWAVLCQASESSIGSFAEMIEKLGGLALYHHYSPCIATQGGSDLEKGCTNGVYFTCIWTLHKEQLPETILDVAEKWFWP